jgi:ATP-dependent Lon protease
MNRSKKQIPEKSSMILRPVLEESNHSDISKFMEEKIVYIQEILRNTILSTKNYKQMHIFSNNDANLSISLLNDLYEKTKEIACQMRAGSPIPNYDALIESLQRIIDKLSMIICGFGTKNIDDLLFISFGSEYKNMKFEDELKQSKYDLIKKHVHPTGYKIIPWRQNKPSILLHPSLCENKIIETNYIAEDAPMLECLDIEASINNFQQKIYGIRVVIQNENLHKTLIVHGILDDIPIDCFTNSYIDIRRKEILQSAASYSVIESEIINRIVETMTLKDVFIYGNEDIHKKMYSILKEVNSIKQNKLDVTIKKFLEMDAFGQRNMLIHLLTYNSDSETKYISYLLYDLITVHSTETPESAEHLNIYESLPYKIKHSFKDVVKYTVKYTNDMIQKYDVQRVSLEQQIYALKAPEYIKEKAMSKLKEIKGKPDEMSTKAKMYLEGLIKIPFCVYREEPILRKMKDNNALFQKIMQSVTGMFGSMEFLKKNKYANLELMKLSQSIYHHIYRNVPLSIENVLYRQSGKQIANVVQHINHFQKNKKEKLISTHSTKPVMIQHVIDHVSESSQETDTTMVEIYDIVHGSPSASSLKKTMSDLTALQSNISSIETIMKSVSQALDESIYSHQHAKNQILKIIGQWMNGEQSGYCFGFEGSPGIGKTSLAKKGLANCLKDENGGPRPFSFIALGGSSNGSSLEGHGYTYVNSSWGKIVDILMEAKCMNPIIYVDELDKVSKTETGKEIIGIFTHLIDSTQNDSFQDKYFSGINIDLSKALFIFSYNDPDQIDRILLDRIHRIRFDNLTLEDKMVIVQQYILPEINKKMGFENIVELSEEIIEYIIESYTVEPGVRKLKELLFDLYGEINLDILKCDANTKLELPIPITKELLEKKYLKKYRKIQEHKIHANPEVGIINGLWANALGRGGIIPIQTMFYPTASFLELRLTGLQGDVMKESMNVAKSLAWNLTPLETKKIRISEFEVSKCQGLHVHCPEGAVSKDGPSAGTAITVAIYSLFNNKKIKNDIAITGEINLQGEVTAIGGLDVKIMGGIRAGIRRFLYPSENERDFQEWKQKSPKNIELAKSIEFFAVSKIDDVFELVFA